MSLISFGRVVRLVRERSALRSELRIGLEAVEKETGRLNFDPEMRYDGDGVRFRRGDVLFGKLRPNLRKAWLADTDGDAVGDFHVYRPIPALMTSRYLAYLVLSEPFLEPVVASVYGSKMPRADWSEIRNIKVWVPGLDEQRAIADYLDRETAQIDAFIAKNAEVITLLTEKRTAMAQAVVERHVGRGARLKHRYREVDVRAGQRWRDLPLLSVSIHHGVVPREESASATDDDVDLSHYKTARAGDIVLNRMRAFQGALGVAPVEGLASPDYAVLRPVGELDAEWLALVMRTPRFVGEMVMRLRGIGSTDSGAVRTPRISVADLGEVAVEVPALSAQLSDVGMVREGAARIDETLGLAHRGVEVARERRAALISAAVSGKIDVGVAA